MAQPCEQAGIHANPVCVVVSAQQLSDGMEPPSRQLQSSQQDTTTSAAVIFLSAAFCCILLHLRRFGVFRRGDLAIAYLESAVSVYTKREKPLALDVKEPRRDVPREGA